MEQFLAKFKEVLKKANEEYGLEIDVMGYVETLRQNKKEVKPIAEEYIHGIYRDIFYREDETQGYTNGEIIVTDGVNEYQITLLDDDKSENYCTCKPTDEGYNEKHKCCGKDCDWVAPQISITKLDQLYNLRFKGTQKDLWEVQDKVEEQPKQNNLDEINELRKALNENLKYINEIATNIYKIHEQLNKLQQAM